MLRARTVPFAATIGPRSMCCCSSTARLLRLLSRSEEASKIVQREVNATSSANSRTTSPYRRMIGRFTGGHSFELVEFEASDQRSRLAFRAQGVVEQGAALVRAQRRGADPRHVAAAVEVDVAGQREGDPL